MERAYAVRVVTYGDSREARRYPYPVTRIARDRSLAGRLALFTRTVWRHGRDADLLFVNDYGLPAMLANVALRKPLVMKIVGDFAWEYSVRHGFVPVDEPLERFQAGRYGPRVELLRRAQAAYAGRADRVITPSEYVRRYVIGWGVAPERVQVVHNAVADPLAGSQLGREERRRRLELPTEADVVLAIARLTPWKGIDTLIRAVGLLREARPSLTLVVVGDGPDRRRLESMAAALEPGAVRFVGEVAHACVADYLGAADVLALCSGYEGLSHVLLEGMAVGLPIIASGVGGNLELIRDGENGLLVPFGDVAATRAALHCVLADRALAARLAAAARHEAAERTVERMVDQTLQVFQDAIEVRGGRSVARSTRCGCC